MFNPILSALLRGSWLIDEQFANNSLPLVLSLLQGKLNGSEFLNGSGDYEGPFYLIPGKGKVNAYKFVEGAGLVLNTDVVIPGAIAVVPFIGPVTKYNGSCGEPGMIRRQQWIAEMTQVPGVIGYISLLDTPGGQADGTPQTADLIKNLQIPTAAVIIGGAYSAGAWIASAHDVIYAADKFSGFGSIGAYTTILDYRGYFEKQGYNLITVYPKVSKDKNLSYRKAIDGDTSLLEDEVGALATSFVDGFSENRPGKLNSDDWKTGKVYTADEAVKIGLIDGIKPLNDVVADMRSGKSSPKINKHQKTNMETKNVKALSGIENPTDEQLSLANADLTAEGITHVTLVPESLITEGAAATAERDGLKITNQTLTNQLAEATKEKTAVEASLTTANTKVTELEAKVEAFGKNAGALNNRAAGDEHHADEGQEQSPEEIMANLPHNKAAAAYLS